MKTTITILLLLVLSFGALGQEKAEHRFEHATAVSASNPDSAGNLFVGL